MGRLTDSQITLADGYYMGSIFAPVLETLDKARLNPDQIDAVLLNGGSCRNPLVVRAFRELDTFRNAEILDKGDLGLGGGARRGRSLFLTNTIRTTTPSPPS